ncbi:MAG: hypothetical protein K0R97_2679 [Oerskovia sp.]|nr:hypothetical protein [Oerskovia sp.]
MGDGTVRPGVDCTRSAWHRSVADDVVGPLRCGSRGDGSGARPTLGRLLSPVKHKLFGIPFCLAFLTPEERPAVPVEPRQDRAAVAAQNSVYPPSTVTTAPVMKLDASLASMTTTGPSSAGVPHRFMAAGATQSS